MDFFKTSRLQIEKQIDYMKQNPEEVKQELNKMFSK